MRPLTASQVATAFECAGPSILPRANRLSAAAERGTVIHEYLENGVKLGWSAALCAVPPEHRADCARVDTAKIDAFTAGAQVRMAEYAMGWQPGTDVARDLKIANREYELWDGEIGGTADLVALYEDRVALLDYKTGHSEVTEAASNWQLRTLAVMAARLFDVEVVDVAIYKLREDGGWWVDAARFTALEIDSFAGEIRKRLEAIAAADKRYQKTGALDVAEGDHCKWCSAMPYCPAKTQLVRSVIGKLDVADKVTALTASEAGEAWLMLGRAQEVIDRVREALEARAHQEPLILPDGRQVRACEEQREYVSGPVAMSVLTEMYGAAVAAQACETKVSSSKKAIAEALGGKKAREALQAIGDKGGIIVKRSTKIKAA